MSTAEQYAPGVSDIRERAAAFSGREWVFERIHDWVKNPAGSRFYLLTAEPGAGKTAIAARLVQFSQGLANPPASCPLFQPGFVNAAHFCSANVGAWIDPTGFARSLSLQLSRSYPGFASMLQLAGERSVNIQVVQNIEKAEKVSGVVIENLVLTGMNPQAAFNVTFTDPLKCLAPFFLSSLHSPAATPAPPGWRSGRPLLTRLAVDAPPSSAPPRADSALPATSENAPSITVSARAKTPGRHRPICEPRFHAGSEKQTSSRKKDPFRAAPGTIAPASRYLSGFAELRETGNMRRP